MAPLTLEGDTLGQRHQHLNKLVVDAVTNKLELTKINYEENDVDNLLKIDVASKTRNVDYIIEVLKCDDMLYVSRAIKQTSWLITEQQYSHIINPEYIHTHLAPHMNTKAVNKLLLHIRLTLKDEKRVEAFYEYLKDSDDALKWLQNCSLPFIENIIKNERRIPLSLLKRLCKKSATFLKYHNRVNEQDQYDALKQLSFMLRSHAEEYLNIVEAEKNCYLPRLSKKPTEIIMKKFPSKILDKFEKIYVRYVDMPTFAKYLKKEDIKDFLFKQVKNEDTKYYFQGFDNLKPFINKMPEQDRFEFVKSYFIDKTLEVPSNERCGMTLCSADYSCKSNFMSKFDKSTYRWYHYAPFNVAFVDIKKLIRGESSPMERCAMLSVLINCAKRNPQHIKTLLQYYFEKHMNEPFKFKIQFVNNILNQTATHEFDVDTWSILDKLFHSMEVYTDSDNSLQMCIKSIILYNVLHDQKVPEIVEKKLSFDTFKKFQPYLNQKDKIFDYLLNFISTKIQNQKIVSESEFNSMITLITNALNLLVDWKKELSDCPLILSKIQELISLKKEHSWILELSWIYNLNKSWRRLMFQESLSLSLNEDVCLNALKHDPQLLARHEDVIETLRANHSVSLRRLLGKMRIYWPQSLSKKWSDAYLQNLDKVSGHKAHIKGLFTLLPQKQFEDIVKKYIPEDLKINWSETDQIELSLRKNIAKNLHTARPQPSLDLVLNYAKGDYLQFTVPSLNAVMCNLSKDNSREYVLKLLDAPVSLQKFGLHLAFMKLKTEELQPIFSNIWKTTKNSTIRTVLFSHTFNLLCKVKDPAVVKELWELLSTFINNLSPEENKNIFKSLSNVDKVHSSVELELYKRSYQFLSSLPPKADCEQYVKKLITYSLNVMERLDSDFVEEKLLSPSGEILTSPKYSRIEIAASYVMWGQTSEEQLKRYKKVLLPALDRAFENWNSVKDDEYHVKRNFNTLLTELLRICKNLMILKKIDAPATVLIEMKSHMEQKIIIEENYVLYTTLKLAIEYIKSVHKQKSMFCDSRLDKVTLSDLNAYLPDAIEKLWEEIHLKVSPAFGSTIVRYLKDDVEKYYPSIYTIFGSALAQLFDEFCFHSRLNKIITLKHMLNDINSIPSVLLVCSEIPQYLSEEEQKIVTDIRKMLRSHPSKEVQLHYQTVFGMKPETVNK